MADNFDGLNPALFGAMICPAEENALNEGRGSWDCQVLKGKSFENVDIFDHSLCSTKQSHQIGLDHNSCPTGMLFFHPTGIQKKFQQMFLTSILTGSTSSTTIECESNRNSIVDNQPSMTTLYRAES
eukprot:TRINITY_DN3918_c0_g1_i6.p1 TRINITY_DN3918_c0_g1~~TRINITY_DN3918_c0_g1_i6.p1  ORF type:complete len:127 (-),score=15.05 TRINITY_DN3918_c0_g1_i6:553-933(-)